MFRTDIHRALDALVIKARAREDELVNRYRSSGTDNGQSSAPLAPGDQDLVPAQDLQDAFFKLEKAKTDLASADKGITQLAIERDRWKRRAEAAKEKLLRLYKKGRQRNRSPGRSDDEETQLSFAERVSNSSARNQTRLFETGRQSARLSVSGPPGLPARESSDSDNVSTCSSDGDSKAKNGRVKPISFDPVPNASGFQSYQLDVDAKVVAASHRSIARTMKWIQQVEAAKLEQLETPSRRWSTRGWDHLESVFAEAVANAVSGPLLKEIQTYRLDRTRQGKSFYGRAALWHVFRKFQLEHCTAMAVDQNLMNLQLHGELAAFMNSWDPCIMTMSDPPNEPLFISIAGSVADSPQRTFRFLYDAANREIARRQNEIVRLDLTQSPRAAHATAAQSAAKKAAAKTKTFAKRQSRRPQVSPPPPAAGDALSTALVASSKEACRFFAAGQFPYCDRCNSSHDDPKAIADAKGSAKANSKAGAGGSRQRSKSKSPRSPKSPTAAGMAKTKEEKKRIPCVWHSTAEGCKRLEKCPYQHG